jgi:hypothetical protein
MESAMGRPPIGKVAMTNAERVARHRTLHPKPVTKPVAEPDEVDALRAELAAKDREIAGLRTTVQKLRAAKPRVQKAPLPPNEERDREIEALKKTNRDLREKIRMVNELHFAEQLHYAKMQKKGSMSSADIRTISKALHPEHAPTERERTAAFKAFNAWKADRRPQERGRQNPA